MGLPSISSTMGGIGTTACRSPSHSFSTQKISWEETFT